MEKEGVGAESSPAPAEVRRQTARGLALNQVPMTWLRGVS